MKISCTAQNSVFKNHPRDILRHENHLYGIVLVHIIHKTALNATKHLQVGGYRIFKNRQNLIFGLTASLTTVARLETKRSSARPPFYATITDSPMGCAFWGSDECRPSAFLSYSIRLLVFFIQRNHIEALIFRFSNII